MHIDVIAPAWMFANDEIEVWFDSADAFNCMIRKRGSIITNEGYWRFSWGETPPLILPWLWNLTFFKNWSSWFWTMDFWKMHIDLNANGWRMLELFLTGYCNRAASVHSRQPTWIYSCHLHVKNPVQLDVLKLHFSGDYEKSHFKKK